MKKKKKAVNSLIFKESLPGSECSYADISRFLKRINQEPHRHAGSLKKASEQRESERAREKKIVWTNSADGFKFPRRRRQPPGEWRRWRHHGGPRRRELATLFGALALSKSNLPGISRVLTQLQLHAANTPTALHKCPDIFTRQ